MATLNAQVVCQNYPQQPSADCLEKFRNVEKVQEIFKPH